MNKTHRTKNKNNNQSKTRSITKSNPWCTVVILDLPKDLIRLQRALQSLSTLVLPIISVLQSALLQQRAIRFLQYGHLM